MDSTLKMTTSDEPSTRPPTRPPTRDPWDSLSWWRNESQARRIELEHNRLHPNNPIRVEVVDTFAGNHTVDQIFNYGLLVIPCLFLVSATLWCVSRFFPFKSMISWYLGFGALLLAAIACTAFIVFGLIFLIGMCSGYEFEYHIINTHNNNTMGERANDNRNNPLNNSYSAVNSLQNQCK